MDKPVKKYNNLSKCWQWKLPNGYFHREDGPACEYDDGTKECCVNGKRHREDGPAIEWCSGSKYWFQNNKLHREDGPAIEWNNGEKKLERIVNEQTN